MKKMNLVVLLVSGFLFVAFLSGCSTWHGFGTDVKKTGSAIENSGK
jgi:predicted small secreted protein